MKKIFLIFLLFTCQFLLVTAKASAISEFSTNFNSLYIISASGKANITHTIILKNNLAQVYAKDYALTTTGDNIKNITISDENGPINYTVNTKKGVTIISIKITNPAIGKDKEKILTINYETDAIAEIIGPTITINIPRLARSNEATSYTRVVKIEGVTNLPSIIYPKPSNFALEGDFAVYTFAGHQNDSLSFLFGQSVTYKLNLNYELRNKQLTAIESEFALPPDTAYQHIVIDNITPPPQNIFLDNDGNWLARYKLNSQTKLNIKASLYATVYPNPTLYDPSKNIIKNNLKNKYWDSNSSMIADLSTRLKNPENIYNYIKDNFTYNYNGINSSESRKGALVALTIPTNVLCTEFTDAFVALARSANIESREINGYGFTKNSLLQPQNVTTDILHAWPEYFDESKKAWISVDPTWGNTTGGIDYFHKLDFSHIAFVRHGEEDSYPLPAGAYKTNSTVKSIDIQVAQSDPQENTSSEIKNDIFYNTGNVAIQNDTVGYVPPYGSVKLLSHKPLSLYDKIKNICAKLFSKFYPQQ